MGALSPEAKTLIEAVQRLSLAQELDEIMQIVRSAARKLVGSDGATFVLRDQGELCYYADEDAIGPLWKGSRFPMSACISGFCMMHREPVIIDDIFADARIPIDLYRTTFVKSLLMVPIRTSSPVGAIGNYWAKPHRASTAELSLVQALADSTSIAIENVRLVRSLERRVEERTAELVAANAELDAFTASASHDLRNPIAGISAAAQALRAHAGDAASVRDVAGMIEESTTRMDRLIGDLRDLSRTARADVRRERVDVSALARSVIDARRSIGSAHLDVDVAAGLAAVADPGLLRIALDNLLGNAIKYSRRRDPAVVRVGAAPVDGAAAFFVADNGAGFDARKADKLFVPFQRLHSSADFEGTGVGLATVARIVRRHGGRIWAESAPDKGATFWFTLAPAGAALSSNQ